MPNKDGFTTLQELKSNPKWRDIPVVVTSNLSQLSDFNRAKELGAVEYLVKSDTAISKIVEKIRDYI
jgi:CheY-like chemotaxis protein